MSLVVLFDPVDSSQEVLFAFAQSVEFSYDVEFDVALDVLFPDEVLFFDSVLFDDESVLSESEFFYPVDSVTVPLGDVITISLLSPCPPGPNTMDGLIYFGTMILTLNRTFSFSSFFSSIIKYVKSY